MSRQYPNPECNPTPETNAPPARQTSRKRLFTGFRAGGLEKVEGLLKQLDTLAAATQGDRMRPVSAANLHLTLNFLGNVEISALPLVVSAMTQSVAGRRGFELTFRGLGAFSNALWLAPVPCEELLSLQSTLEQRLDLAGFSVSGRRFVPHVTVARLGKGSGFDVPALVSRYRELEWGALSVSQVELFESRTLPQGAEYSTLHSIELAD